MNKMYNKFYSVLKLSGKASSTIETYERHIIKLENYYNKTPDKVTEKELLDYLLYMKDVKKYSEAFFKQALSSFRFFLRKHVIENGNL